eukprot:scaffold903_cov296-Ochromonas_danica.AAC.2
METVRCISLATLANMKSSRFYWHILRLMLILSTREDIALLILFAVNILFRKIISTILCIYSRLVEPFLPNP